MQWRYTLRLLSNMTFCTKKTFDNPTDIVSWLSKRLVYSATSVTVLHLLSPGAVLRGLNIHLQTRKSRSNLFIEKYPQIKLPVSKMSNFASFPRFNYQFCNGALPSESSRSNSASFALTSKGSFETSMPWSAMVRLFSSLFLLPIKSTQAPPSWIETTPQFEISRSLTRDFSSQISVVMLMERLLFSN